MNGGGARCFSWCGLTSSDGRRSEVWFGLGEHAGIVCIGFVRHMGGRMDISTV